MDSIRQQAQDTARSVRFNMEIREPEAAAEGIHRWIQGVHEVKDTSGSAYWERFCVKVLFQISTMVEDASALIQGGYIEDTNIIDTFQHVMDQIESGELDVADVPMDNVLPFPAATLTQEEATDDSAAT